ncbi:TPA: hypothetical protein ACX6S4_003010 [Photobacterium damselae]
MNNLSLDNIKMLEREVVTLLGDTEQYAMADCEETISIMAEANTRLTSCLNETITERKAIGRPPRLPRSKNPEKKAKQQALRDLVLQQKAKLDARKSKLESDIEQTKALSTLASRFIHNPTKALHDPDSLSDPIYRFWIDYKRMINAIYCLDEHGEKYSTTPEMVAERFMFAVNNAHKEYCREWLESANRLLLRLGAWGGCKGNEYSSFFLLMSYMSAKKRVHLYPAEIPLEHVFDGFKQDDSHHAIREDINQIIGKKRDRAISFTQLGASRTKLSHVDEIMPLIQNSIKDNLGGNFFLSAPMGGVYNVKIGEELHNSGSKTDGVLLPTVKDALEHGKYVTIVLHRRTLTFDTKTRVTNYLNEHLPRLSNSVWHYDERSVFNLKRVLIVCVNSLSRPHIKEHLTKSEVVLFDEFTQTLGNLRMLEDDHSEQAIAQSPSYEKSVETLDLIFHQFSNNNKTILVIDADLNEHIIYLIEDKTDTKQYNVIMNITHPERELSSVERSRQVVFHRNIQSRKLLLNRINELAELRLEQRDCGSPSDRFFIAIDNKSQSVALNDYCLSMGLRTCLINADTMQAKGEQKGAYALVNHQCSPNLFDVVIYTPTITSGCSWAEPDYKQGIIITTKVIKSSDLKQMGFRFRFTKHIDVFATDNQTLTTTDTVNHELLIETSGKSDYPGAYSLLHDYMRTVDLESTKQQREFLYYQFEAEGWGCSTVDHSAKPSIDVNTNKLDNSARINSIIDQKPLSAIEHSQIVRRTDLSYDDIESCIRYETAIHSALSFNPDDIRLCLSTKNVQEIQSLLVAVVLRNDPALFDVLNQAMSELIGWNWLQRLEQGEDLSFASKSALDTGLRLIADDKYRAALYSAGVFDRGSESNHSRWYRTDRLFTVIGRNKVKYPSTKPLIERVSNSFNKALHASMQAYPLIDGNVLTVNSVPKNKQGQCSIISRLLQTVGIEITNAKGEVRINGGRIAKLLSIAKRKAVSLIIKKNIGQDNFSRLTIECWDDDGYGFEFIARNDNSVEFECSGELARLFAREEQLTESGCVVVSGFEKLSPFLQSPLYTMDDGDFGDKKRQKLELSLEKQLLKKYNKHPHRQFVNRFILIILADKKMVELMLTHHLKIKTNSKSEDAQAVFAALLAQLEQPQDPVNYPPLAIANT